MLDKTVSTRLFCLTYNSDFYGGWVLHVFNFQDKCVFSRVISLSRTNEKDGVHVWVPDIHFLFIHWLPVLQPCSSRTRFALKTHVYLLICETTWIWYICFITYKPGRGWQGWFSLRLSWCIWFWVHEADGF